MLKTNTVFYFDSTEFISISHHYIDQANYSLAEKSIKMGLDQHPNNTDLMLLNSELLIFNSKYEDAYKILNYLEEVDPENREVYLQKATIYSKNNLSDEAIAILKRALLFIDDKNLTSITNKEGLWLELINHGYKLGDRILNLSDPELRGSDVEELQELLSRLGFYSEPINGIFNTNVVFSVTAFQENRGLSIDGNVGHGTVNEIKMLMRPNLNTSLNEAIKSISPNLSTSVIGHSVCFDIPNEQDYAAQIDTYEVTKSVCLENNIIASFASEVGKTTKEENIIKYVNKIQPTLFVSFKKSDDTSLAYFKGSFTESRFGKDLSSKVKDQLEIKNLGKAHSLLKNTKSVSLIFFGNFYQNDKVSKILDVVLKSLNDSFKN